MPLTPADIHNMAFKKPPVGKRGYDEESVDALLDEAGQELIRLIEENDDLRSRIGDGPAGPAGPSPLQDQQREFADLVERLKNLQEGRRRAEQDARDMQARLERARDEAQAAGPAPAADGDRSVRVLMMAQRTADDHMRDAREESDDVMANAQTEAERITVDARAEAGAIESGARRGHAEAMDGLAQRRTALLNEIDGLEELARGYRTALGSHVARQLQDLDGAPEVA
ncbi:DivIVA domain-containing protein [Actinoplanes sp. TBRC 11911]|uniref:DivIVA domain-containing protein n=1 Tax=Actinoplanes sp. TBRC 11911 TaxID=2729386 RepID=UPI00145D8989|nr:DivIVA domain-containing protein [Actinoplanes sp. TBRC 11911]NMO51147.1 DivIVA domain-containing protein [Actinoplanes sp. TBRC 11911]